MVDNVKLGLGKADGSMDSGFRLVGYKWIFAEGSFVSHDIEPTWDLDDISWVVDKSMSGERLGCLLIQCSPFMAKNGRLLFEGDIVISRNNKEKGVICQGKNGSWYAKWRIGISASNFNKLRCTGSIYLKDGE